MTPQDAVSELITNHKLSQKTIADRVDTTQATISRIQTGKSEPGYSLAKKIIDLHQEIINPQDDKAA